MEIIYIFATLHIFFLFQYTQLVLGITLPRVTVRYQGGILLFLLNF